MTSKLFPHSLPEYAKYGEWKKRFAWLPTKTKNGTVWLKPYQERTVKVYSYDNWLIGIFDERITS